MLGLGAQLPLQCFLFTLAVLLVPGSVHKLFRHMSSILLAIHKAIHRSYRPRVDLMVTGTWLKVNQLPRHLSRPAASTSYHQAHQQEEILQKQKTLCQIVSMPGKEISFPPFHQVKLREILYGGQSISFQVPLIPLSGPPASVRGMDRRECNLNTGYRHINLF